MTNIYSLEAPGFCIHKGKQEENGPQYHDYIVKHSLWANLESSVVLLQTLNSYTASLPLFVHCLLLVLRVVTVS